MFQTINLTPKTEMKNKKESQLRKENLKTRQCNNLQNRAVVKRKSPLRLPNLKIVLLKFYFQSILIVTLKLIGLRKLRIPVRDISQPFSEIEAAVKVGLLPSKNNCVICFINSSLKMIKNAFYFILKAFFVLKIFKFLS